MAFDLQIWRQRIEQRLANLPAWREKLETAGVRSLYAALSAMALWPVVEAAQKGEWAALTALGGVLAGVGGDLLAGRIQSWNDEVDAARDLEAQVPEDTDMRREVDELLEALEVLPQAREAWPEDREAWFVQTLREELAQLGNLERFSHTLIWASGDRSVAAETIQDSIFMTGDITHIDTYVERQEVDSGERTGEAALIRYLRRLRRFCNALPLAALSEEGAAHRRAEVSLNHVYIQLQTTTPEDTALGSEVETAPLEQGSPREEGGTLSALEAASRERCLVILGDPGSGKSTFANYLAYLLAGARLGVEPGPEGWPHGPLLPIRIVLRELAGHLPAADELARLSGKKQAAHLVQGIWHYLRQELAVTYQAAAAEERLLEAVDDGQALVIFDGLDEVAVEQRPVVRQAVEAFGQLCGQNRLLVTCRVRSYDEQSRLPAFVQVTLAPFSEEQIDDFVRRWYRALADLGTLKPQQAVRRADDLRGAVQPLLELARNPLLLTTMAVVHTAQVELPRERARLYKRCVDVLLRRWHKHKAGELPLLKQLQVSEAELLAGLWEVAFAAHEMAGTKRAGGLPRSEVLRLLAGHLGGYGRAEQFLDYVDARAGLLVGQGGSSQEEPVYTFPHRTFQEYLAGCHLALGGRHFGRRLRGLLAEGDRWALVAQLGAEHLLYNAVDLTRVLDALYALCPAAAPQSEDDWRGTLWAGSLALEVSPKRIAEDEEAPDGGRAFLSRLPPRLVAIVEQEHLAAQERAEAGRELGRLGDPRFRPDAWYLPDEKLLGFVRVPAGAFTMGTKEEDIPALQERYGGSESWYKREVPQHELSLPTFYMARYPVTVGQFRAFVEASGYESRDERSLQGIGNHPVRYVTWHDAVAYCRWLTEALQNWPETPEPLATLLREEGWRVALPSEAEWEKAARGTDGREYPWGDELTPERANYRDTGIGTTSAVGCFPGGKSPYGLLDMSGNTWEWTRSKFEPYPYESRDGREELGGGEARVLRGGSFGYLNPDLLRCAARFQYYAHYLLFDLYGFRCVVVAPFSPP